MEKLLAFSFTFMIGACGYYILKFLKIPNPSLLGAIFATGVLNITGYYPEFPVWPVSFAANVLIGMMLGRQIDIYFFKRVGELFIPVISTAVGMVVLSIICGMTYFKLASVSMKTALIASSAGGIAEMMIFGLSVNADIPVVATVQIFRVIVFLTLIPFIPFFDKKSNNRNRSDRINMGLADTLFFRGKDYILLTLVSIIGAVITDNCHVPAGAMIGAMLASGIFAIMIKRTYSYAAELCIVAQIGLGVVIGYSITPKVLLQLRFVFLPTIATTVVMLLCCIVIALALKRVTRWSITTCLLCAAPAGLSQIAVYAEEIGADSFTTSVFHTVRLATIVLVYPWIIIMMS